ncbi:MAG: hypothetical protein WCT05_16305, partial [Lentisphaeria bacterium]
IWGVGEKTGQILERYGLKRIVDLQQSSLAVLVKLLGASSGQHLFALAHGQDTRQVQWEPRPEKSFSREETFLVDCQDMEQVRRCLLRLCEEVGGRLRQSGMQAGCAQLKLRFRDFRTITRQMPIRPPSATDRILLNCAASLFAQAAPNQAIRLVGFGASQLSQPGDASSEPPRQLLLFPETQQEMPVTGDPEKNASLDKAIDQLREKFGSEILQRGWDKKK